MNPFRKSTAFILLVVAIYHPLLASDPAVKGIPKSSVPRDAMSSGGLATRSLLNRIIPAAILLRSQKYKGGGFCVQVAGSAIKESTRKSSYEVLFDTGSWTTSLPYDILDREKITVLEADVKDCWGSLSDKVKGQLALRSQDGKIQYAVDDYIFFALKKPGARVIMGAFPSELPWSSKLPSLPYAIALKYSPEGNVGLGIISDFTGSDLAAGWSEGKSYLKIGNDADFSSHLNWRNDIPLFHGRSGFQPEAVPGFTVTLSFPSSNGKMVPDIVVPNLMATIDTGAPELNLRLGENNPHRQVAYAPFFTSESTGKYDWRKKEYKVDSLLAANGAKIRVGFTGSAGRSDSYTFASSTDFQNCRNSVVIAGDWNGKVPWPVSGATPRNRISLGNSIYFFCPVYYWDITNRRVGILFR